MKTGSQRRGDLFFPNSQNVCKMALTTSKWIFGSFFSLGNGLQFGENQSSHEINHFHYCWIGKCVMFGLWNTSKPRCVLSVWTWIDTQNFNSQRPTLTPLISQVPESFPPDTLSLPAFYLIRNLDNTCIFYKIDGFYKNQC